MNSEELELSLRSEFENYLNGVFAGMRQDVADYQKNFQAEFEKHQSQMEEAFRNLSARFDTDVKFDRAFTESVVEHLRLARDDGAQLTARAFADAEQLDRAPASPSNYDVLRDAINEISSQLTQSAILKSLVDRVSDFAPRGAFFIVKHDNFVCWRKFDASGHADDETVQSIHFPIQADSLLAEAVRTLNTQSGSGSSHTVDSQYLTALGFGRPDRMWAVPLLARGRAVAILYADPGNGDQTVNVEAIESLVRVAGLTVELRAASAAVQPAAVETPSSVPMQDQQRNEPVDAAHETSEAYAENDEAEAAVGRDTAEPSRHVEEYTGEVAVEEVPAVEEPSFESDQSSVVESSSEDDAGYFTSPEAEESYGSDSEDNEPVETAPGEPVSDFAFASNESFDATAEVEHEAETAAEVVEEYSYAGDTGNGTNGRSYEAAPESVVEVAVAKPAKSRLSDRNVDLPIEVSDDERRLHNDARRFARLLVSEIKLYNEQKVNEGRDASDLYDRLREAIDRSREMYEKRVQPQVAAKFDYFHYELVNNLAEGKDSKLGASYPGATV